MLWDANLYDQQHAFVTAYGADVLNLLAPQRGERILDIGCGTGHLTNQIADSGAQVVGLDHSAEMIVTARAAYPHLEFIHADASNFAVAEPFDALFSNAALHWVTEAEAAVTCMARALKPGGRFVVEFGGKGNVQQIYGMLETVVAELTQTRVTAANFFPSIGEYATLLERHGIAVTSAWLFDRFTRLEAGEAGLTNWVRMFRRHVLELLTADEQAAVLAEMEKRLRPALYRDDAWHADYRRLRIVAQKLS